MRRGERDKRYLSQTIRISDFTERYKCFKMKNHKSNAKERREEKAMMKMMCCRMCMMLRENCIPKNDSGVNA